MRQKSNMIIISLVFSVFLLTKLNTCYDVRSVDVVQDLSLSDFIFTDDVLFDTSVRSPLECAQVCSAMEECASFTYHRDSLTSCRGHTSAMTSNSSSTAAAGTKAYVISRALSDSPESLGYTFDMMSGLWYKLHDVNADYVTARSTCESEGASLVTLDTEAKLALFYTPSLLPDLQYYRVGATRPLAQWDTPWNQSSDFFVWTRTGESLQNISSHFAPGVPKFEANYNCVSLYYISIYTQLGLFGLLFDEDCQIEKRFICERV